MNKSKPKQTRQAPKATQAQDAQRLDRLFDRYLELDDELMSNQNAHLDLLLERRAGNKVDVKRLKVLQKKIDTLRKRLEPVKERLMDAIKKLT